MKTFLSIIKWTGIYAAFFVASIIVGAYLDATTPLNAALWSAIIMGWAGLAVGAAAKRGK